MPVVSLSRLLGQPDAADYLRGVVSRGRYANAYLFQGPAGAGKGTAAIAFARAVLCDRVAGAAPAAPLEEPPSLFGDASAAGSPSNAMGDDACGACAACVKTAALLHADLKILFPLSGEEDLAKASYVEQIQLLRDDPLFTFTYEKAASIRIFQTKELIRELAYKPFEAARRAVVVRDCDRMREDQYSTLLKSIEEPDASTVWILTTSRPNRVPVTIRSRCQRVRFAPLPEALVREYLVQRAGVTESDARMLAALSGGSLARAIDLREVDARAQRDQALQLLDAASAGDPARLFPIVQRFMNYGRTGREQIRRTLEFHMLMLRDLLRAKYELDRETLVHRDREKEVRLAAARLEPAELRRRLMVLEEAMRSIEGNVSPELTLFSTLQRVAGLRTGEGCWPAHATARWDY
jgi:DNA polymerase-3 subunit delta'